MQLVTLVMLLLFGDGGIEYYIVFINHGGSCVGVLGVLWWCMVDAVGLDCDDVGCAGYAVYIYI
jgi:hypothetical protein